MSYKDSVVSPSYLKVLDITLTMRPKTYLTFF